MIETFIAITVALQLPTAALFIDDPTVGAILAQLVSDPRVASDVRFFLDAREAEPGPAEHRCTHGMGRCMHPIRRLAASRAAHHFHAPDAATARIAEASYGPP